EHDRFFTRLGRTLTISLVLHLVVLLLVMGLRLSPRGERPLASVEVNLVSLPHPVKTVEPVKRAETKPEPTPAVKKSAPAAVPAPARVSAAKDILKDLELPPDAPKFGELTPAKSVAQPQPQAQTKVKLHEPPIIDDMVAQPLKKTQQAASIREELDRELEELKKVKEFKPAAKLDIPKDVPAKPSPQQEAAIPQTKAPQTQLKT